MSHHGKHGYPKTKQIRSELRKAAEELQAEYNKLSLEEKIARLPPEPGAQKQRKRLLALLEERNKAPTQTESGKEEKKQSKKRK